MISFTACILSVCLVILLPSVDCSKENKLVAERRSFLASLDKDKLLVYLSSFGGDNDNVKHQIFKRSVRRKKTRTSPTPDISTTTTTDMPKIVEETKMLKQQRKFFSLPKDIVKFELDDAKYSEEYEKHRRSKKFRIKRSTAKNASEDIATDKARFVRPREILRFEFSDAVTTTPDVTENGAKAKREIDSFATESKNIKIMHPLASQKSKRGNRLTKNVSFDEMPNNLKKMIEIALTNSVKQNKAKHGDFLKFYYGDRKIIVPVTLAKYLAIKSDEQQQQQQQQQESSYENPFTTAPLHYLGTKNNYFPLQKQIFTPTTTKTQENSEKSREESLYRYKPYSEGNSISSTGPVLFEATTTSSVESPQIYLNQNSIVPITEELFEDQPFKRTHPGATSYVEFSNGNIKSQYDSHDTKKNYEFGYHVSDLKSGNNYGHSQTRDKGETKGEYKILLPDGRIQIVRYFADDSGYNAVVTYKTIH